jgi:UDP-glucose 4-epimerase
MNINKMKILVTGGAGFIGSHVADWLVNADHDVSIIDNLSLGNKENINKKARFYQNDLSDFKKIEEIFEREKPEIIYHLAAHIDVRKSLENPVFDAEMNIVNSLNLLQLSSKYDIRHFIFSSTGGAIYENGGKMPSAENEKESPESPYGCAKLAVEKYLNYYHKVHGLEYTILRYSNVFGPRQNAKGEAGVISIFFDKMLYGKSPTIFGGDQTRDFVYVEDVAIANLLALKDSKCSTYNISTRKETSINQIFEKVNSIFDNNFKPIYEEAKKGEVFRSCMSHDKISRELGWQPNTSLDDGLMLIYASLTSDTFLNK